jgi:hypothetical protein
MAKTQHGPPSICYPERILDQQALTERSPRMAKNPVMSAYLSAANRVANTARGRATGEVKRQAKRQSTTMMNEWLTAWTPKPVRRRKRR